MDSKFQVLLIDDNASLHGTVQDTLASEGITVRSATDAAEGLRMLEANPSDLLLLDLGLPDMDGFELLRRIKADPGLKDTPVIVLTAWNSASDKVRGFDLGAADYVTKPFEASELRARVRAALRQQQLQQRLLEFNHDLELARQRAEEATRIKSQFLANMSHEIRTPMNGVIAATSLLLESELAAAQRELVETIRTSGEHLLEVINDILDISKIEAGRMELEVRPFDLHRCVEDATSLLASRFAAKNLELNVEMAPDLPAAVQGDNTRLCQVLVNLLGNALKFTERGGVTLGVTGQPVREVALKEQASINEGAAAAQAAVWELEFRVRDTGMGIPQAKLENLFQPFTQVDATTTRRFGGTGLGLAICRHLVEMMDGEIRAESEQGRGTEFTFQVRMAAVEEGVAPAAGEPVLPGLRLLLVDHQAGSRRALELNARKWGASVTAAADGFDAVESVRGGLAVDVVVLDLDLPVMDGLKLRDELRLLPATKSAPLIALTTGESAARSVEGFHTCLTRPVKPDQLLRVLRALPRPEVGAGRRLDAKLAERLPLHVLVVDDNAINQRVAHRVLQQMGYYADTAANGIEAVDATVKKPYDIIFMDVQMPELDGYDAARQIRERESAGTAPRSIIIAMTANAMAGDREKCLAAGMDDYLAKPVRPEGMQEALKRWGPLARGRHPKEARRAKQGEPVEVPSREAAPPSVPSGKRAGDDAPVDFDRIRDLSGGDAGELCELIQFYLAQTATQIEEIQAAVVRGDAGAVKRVAHSCAGSSGSCGVVALLPSLRELELRAARGSLEGAAALADEAARQFARARAFFEQRIESILPS
jgi:CheY-like chemotaxis protein/HPt (histidine-containing phosphotransfer) domain-containing protein